MIGHRVVLRPRNIPETGDLAFTFMRSHARLFALLLPWTLVPALIAFGLSRFFDMQMPLAAFLVAAATSFGSGVYVVLCGDLMLADTVDLRSVQRRFLRSLLPFAIARLAGWLVTVVTIGFAYASAAFVPEGVLLERGTISKALSRSGALMRAVPGRALGFGVVLVLVTLIGAVGGELARYEVRELFGLSNLEIRMFEGPLGWATALGIGLVAPYLEALRFLLYIDARTRREGWDLQVQMNALVQVAEKRREREAA